MTRGGGGGRIHVHQSETDDTVPIIGADIVAARGEWSMGKILDIYFQFAMGGDYYLGRLLTLIPPEDKLFDSLPPHWKDQEHTTVAEALKLTFGKALTSHQGTANDPTGVLGLVSIVQSWHKRWKSSKRI